MRLRLVEKAIRELNFTCSVQNDLGSGMRLQLMRAISVTTPFGVLAEFSQWDCDFSLRVVIELHKGKKGDRTFLR